MVSEELQRPAGVAAESLLLDGIALYELVLKKREGNGGFQQCSVFSGAQFDSWLLHSANSNMVFFLSANYSTFKIFYLRFHFLQLESYEFPHSISFS